LSLAALAAGAAGAAAMQIDLHAINPCAHPRPDEILICRSKDERSPYRLPKPSEKYEPKKLHPENVVPGGRIHVESGTRPDGLVDKRVMITFGLPF
jgi:hypothetical protein